MSTNPMPDPPAVPFDPAKLSPAQLDGLACVDCGASALTGDKVTIPVGMVNGSQVFACRSCARPADCPTWCESTHAPPDGEDHFADVVNVEQSQQDSEIFDGPASLIVGLRQQPGGSPLVSLSDDRQDNLLTPAETRQLIGEPYRALSIAEAEQDGADR